MGRKTDKKADKAEQAPAADEPQAAPAADAEQIPAADDAGQAPETIAADKVEGNADGLVRVRALRTIGFGGIVIRPKIDDSKPGAPPVITPVEGVIPAALAVSYGPDYVEVIGPAAEGAKVGPITKQK